MHELSLFSIAYSSFFFTIEDRTKSPNTLNSFFLMLSTITVYIGCYIELGM